MVLDLLKGVFLWIGYPNMINVLQPLFKYLSYRSNILESYLCVIVLLIGHLRCDNAVYQLIDCTFIN
jgi:hypothetical protein